MQDVANPTACNAKNQRNSLGLAVPLQLINICGGKGGGEVGPVAVVASQCMSKGLYI